MNYRHKFLKVKIKSLAAEQGIIRVEQRRALSQGNYELHHELHNHRVKDVRYEARHAHIAYGLVRGRKLEQIERHSKSEFDKKRVDSLLKKYGSAKDAPWYQP